MFGGFTVTVGTLVLFFPEIAVVGNIKAAIAITGVKFIFNYYTRRYFTHRDKRYWDERLAEIRDNNHKDSS